MSPHCFHTSWKCDSSCAIIQIGINVTIQKYHVIYSYGPRWISFTYKTEIKQRIQKSLCINFILCTHCEDYHYSISMAKHKCSTK